MRTTLIMFAVLLIVLTLLSTLGGSILPKKEPFYVDEQPVAGMGGEVSTEEEEAVVPPMAPSTTEPPIQPVATPVAGPATTPSSAPAGVPEPFTQNEQEEYAAF